MTYFPLHQTTCFFIPLVAPCKPLLNIGDNNKIQNTTIGDNVTFNNSGKKERFNERHPYITGVAISVIAGFILLFSFWNQIVQFIEGWF